MGELKKLFVNGQEFEYKVCSEVSEYDTYTWTEFYRGVEPVTYRKYWLFGERVTVYKPILVFKIYRDIENKGYTKAEVRKWIEREVELLNRADEIKKGEII